MKDKVIFILGPTAVGKSYFGIKLAQKFGGEIISADSVQIYRGLDIGSAKQLDTHGVVHHAIDILEPEENFSVFEFVEYTKQKIKEITASGKLPIVVGGTGLYIKALTLGYNFGGAEKDDELRSKLERIAEAEGVEKLFEILQSLDPEMAAKIDKFNPVRLVRAIEIASQKGEKQTSEVDIDPLVIAVTKDREKLYADINLRVDQMFEEGLLEEVKGLLARGLTEENQSMRAIGYKEVVTYIKGECSFEEMSNLIKQHTRNYAKRQMTFLRGMDCTFVGANDRAKALEDIEKIVGDFLR